jgi:hypothetical protein
MFQFQQSIVCEKTDGVRYFLIVTKSREYFIVDRNYEFKRVLVLNSTDYVNSVYKKMPNAAEISSKIDSIFDGELVLDNKEDGNPEKLPSYLAFDCLVAGGNNFMHLHFRQRLQAGLDYICNNYTVYRQHIIKNNLPTEQQWKLIDQRPFI